MRIPSQSIEPPFDRELDDSESSFTRVAELAWHHKWGVVFFVLAISLLSLPIIYSITPQFRAAATLIIGDRSSAGSVSIESILANAVRHNKHYMNTQLQVLKSRELARRVVARLDLGKKENFIVPQNTLFRDLSIFIGFESEISDTVLSMNQLVSYLLLGLAVEHIRQTQLVQISYVSTDAQLAADIANTIMFEYIAMQNETKAASTQETTDFLRERLGVLKNNLEASEVALQAFRDKHNLVDTQGVKGLSTMKLDSLSSKLLDARNIRSEAEVVYRQVQREKAKGVKSLQALPAIMNHALVQDYQRLAAEAERKLVELRQRYGPKHPKRIQAEADVKEARRGLVSNIEAVVVALQKNYENARQNENRIRAQVAEATKDVRSIDQVQYKLNSLHREVDANKKIYSEFLDKNKITAEAAEIKNSSIKVLDKAILPVSPFKPNVKRLLIMVVFFSLLAAFFIIWLLEKLDNTLSSREDIESKLRQPILGLIPKVKPKEIDDTHGSIMAFRDDSHILFAESVRTIRTGLLMSNLDGTNKITLVTSSIPGEGKSTTTLNLALAMSTMAKVLLIDADMRRPTIAKAIGLPRDAKGLSQYTAGTAKISEAVHQLEDSQLMIMPSGIIPPNPLELISSSKFKEALAVLGESFDHIMIDSPPVMAVSDALVLSGYANSIVYVVRADDTDIGIVKNGLKNLYQVNGSISGIVLNMYENRGLKTHYGEYDYYAADA